MKSPKRAPRKRKLEHRANPVQRLLIVHEGLPDLCGGIDEGACIAELSEHILYFYDANLHFLNGADESSHATMEAVHFAGLSSALRSLPSAMDGSEDHTTEVHFDKAMIIFIPLEEAQNHKVMAVVQVTRSLGSSSASPFAIRSAIQRCHDLFCILRCGGIHRRLSDGQYQQSKRTRNPKSMSSAETVEIDDDEPPPPELLFHADLGQDLLLTSTSIVSKKKKSVEEEQDDSAFPGMKQLYNRRKEARKLREKLQKTSELLTIKRSALEQELEKVEDLIRQLLDILPIQKLRQHLMEHFNEFLVDMGTASFAGVAFRCLIDCVPVPVPAHGKGATDYHQSSTPTAFASIHVGRFIQSFVDNTATNDIQESLLFLGASSFFKGQLLYTQTRATIPVIPEHKSNFSLGINISNRTASLVMGYMASFRQKMEHAVQYSSRNLLQDQQPHFLAGRFSRIYISPSNDDSSAQEVIDDEQSAHRIGSYLTSPPLSMLNVSDDVRVVNVPSFGKVWTLSIYIPIQGQINEKNLMQVNAVLFDVADFSFLLYFNLGDFAQVADVLDDRSDGTKVSQLDDHELGFSPNTIPMSPCSEFLERLAHGLTACVLETGTLGHTGSLSLSNVVGQHTIFVDRSTEKLVLFSNRGILTAGDDSKGLKLGVGFRKSHAAMKATDDNTTVRNSMEASPMGLDCRHLLANHLSEDVVLAFDDMMTFVRDARSQRGAISVFDKYRHGDVFETCTYLAQGWMWASASGDKELYMYFDSKKYSTITDIENIARSTRNVMFHEDCNRI